MLTYKKSIIYRNQENCFILIKEGEGIRTIKSILDKIHEDSPIPSLYEEILDRDNYLDNVNNYQDIENTLIGLIFYCDISIGDSRDWETGQIDDIIINIENLEKII